MIQSPFNYTGSKFKILGQIIPKMDFTKPYFLDLFCGGGSVYANVLDRYEKVVANDIIKDLMGIHYSLLMSDKIIHETKNLCPGKNNKQGFVELRQAYNENKTSAKLWALILSSTNNMIRFNKSYSYNQTYGDRGWNANIEKKVIGYVNHIRKYKEKLKFVSRDFKNISIKTNKVMVYCDPPYSNTVAGYNAYWGKNDDENLYKWLVDVDNVGSSFMVSGILDYDGKPCPLLNRLISNGYKCLEIEKDYNKVSRKGLKNVSEVVIFNY
jgi:DNA adenine methylase